MSRVIVRGKDLLVYGGTVKKNRHKHLLTLRNRSSKLYPGIEIIEHGEISNSNQIKLSNDEDVETFALWLRDQNKDESTKCQQLLTNSCEALIIEKTLAHPHAIKSITKDDIPELSLDIPDFFYPVLSIVKQPRPVSISTLSYRAVIEPHIASTVGSWILEDQ